MILVTGGNGLCGEAIKRIAPDFTYIGRADADLCNADEVCAVFDHFQPTAVIHTAATVGGIMANLNYPETFFYDNILINANIIRNCIDFKVDRLLAFSSVCVFPDNLSLLEEDKINDGPVYGANFAYGYAKRMVDVHIRAAKIQHGFKNWCSVIPGNIFGKADNFSLNDAHIVPALIHKLYLAIQNNTDLKMWGDGLSLREFIYVDDLAKILVNLLRVEDTPDKVIVSGRKEISIKEITEMLVEISGFPNHVVWEADKPNGQRSRPSSKERIDSLFPEFEYTPIRDGLEQTWNWFCSNYPNVRI